MRSLRQIRIGLLLPLLLAALRAPLASKLRFLALIALPGGALIALCLLLRARRHPIGGSAPRSPDRGLL